jgi:hypothetical protein
MSKLLAKLVDRFEEIQSEGKEVILPLVYCPDDLLAELSSASFPSSKVKQSEMIEKVVKKLQAFQK